MQVADDETGLQLLREFQRLFGTLARLHGDDASLEALRDMVAFDVLNLFPRIDFKRYTGQARNNVVKIPGHPKMTRAKAYHFLRMKHGYQHYLADGIVRCAETVKGGA